MFIQLYNLVDKEDSKMTIKSHSLIKRVILSVYK